MKFLNKGFRGTRVTQEGSGHTGVCGASRKTTAKLSRLKFGDNLSTVIIQPLVLINGGGWTRWKLQFLCWLSLSLISLSASADLCQLHRGGAESCQIAYQPAIAGSIWFDVRRLLLSNNNNSGSSRDIKA